MKPVETHKRRSIAAPVREGVAMEPATVESLRGVTIDAAQAMFVIALLRIEIR